MRLWQELRRRRIFRLTGLYIVGAWVAIQVAATFFPAWEIPETALRYLILASFLGYPIALVFGWFYDLTADGIVRTASAAGSDDVDYRLRTPDYLILLALAGVAGAVVFGSVTKVREVTMDQLEAGLKLPNSLAVLPFLNLSNDPDTLYFSDGITEEVLHRLSAIEALNVLARTSSFGFRGDDTPLPEVSDILGVRYLLQGSVRRDRDQVRITATLVDERGFQVWSESYDRELDKIFVIQSEIANSVASRLVAEIAPTRPGAPNETSDMEAYRNYLLGRDYLNRRTPNWSTQARAAFERAIELDPDYARPYASLAVVAALQAQSDPPAFAAEIRQAKDYVDEALRLDAQLAEAHAARGLLFQLDNPADFSASEEALRRAVTLDRTLVIAYNWLSIALRSQRKHSEADATRDAALQIDPLNPVLNVNAAIQLSNMGEYARAREILLRQLQVPQPSGLVYWTLYSLHKAQGELVEAHRWRKQIVVLLFSDDMIDQYYNVSMHYRNLGMFAEADYWQEKASSSDPNAFRVLLYEAYRLKIDGKFREMATLVEQQLEKGPVNDAYLPQAIGQIWGMMNVLAGNYERGIDVLARIIDAENLFASTQAGGSLATDFVHALAYAYRATGQRDLADEALQDAAEYFVELAERDQHSGGGTLALMALNRAMRGDYDGGARTLSDAVDAGWRDYYYVLHDPRWQLLLEREDVQALMERVRADLERQRTLIEADDDEDNLRDIVAQLESEL